MASAAGAPSPDPYAEHDPLTGRFRKGKGGRKAGSRNKVTVAIENMFEGEGEAIARKTIDLALAGDVYCIKLVLDRIVPQPKGRPLPPIDVRQGESLSDAVIRALTEGRISPADGQAFMNTLESAQRGRADATLADVRAHQLNQAQAAKDRALGGGVMLVPMASPTDWEAQAVESQRLLKEKVRE